MKPIGLRAAAKHLGKSFRYLQDLTHGRRSDLEEGPDWYTVHSPFGPKTFLREHGYRRIEKGDYHYLSPHKPKSPLKIDFTQRSSSNGAAHLEEALLPPQVLSQEHTRREFENLTAPWRRIIASFTARGGARTAEEAIAFDKTNTQLQKLEAHYRPLLIPEPPLQLTRAQEAEEGRNAKISVAAMCPPELRFATRPVD
jgi:hypothetical protein